MKYGMRIFRDFEEFEKLFDTLKMVASRLESVYTGNCIKGSNPFLSARKNAEFISAFFVYAIPQNTGQNCICAVLPIFFAVIYLTL